MWHTKVTNNMLSKLNQSRDSRVVKSYLLVGSSLAVYHQVYHQITFRENLFSVISDQCSWSGKIKPSCCYVIKLCLKVWNFYSSQNSSIKFIILLQLTNLWNKVFNFEKANCQKVIEKWKKKDKSFCRTTTKIDVNMTVMKAEIHLNVIAKQLHNKWLNCSELQDLAKL